MIFYFVISFRLFVCLSFFLLFVLSSSYSCLSSFGFPSPSPSPSSCLCSLKDLAFFGSGAKIPQLQPNSGAFKDSKIERRKVLDIVHWWLSEETGSWGSLKKRFAGCFFSWCKLMSGHWFSGDSLEVLLGRNKLYSGVVAFEMHKNPSAESSWVISPPEQHCHKSFTHCHKSVSPPSTYRICNILPLAKCGKQNQEGTQTTTGHILQQLAIETTNRNVANRIIPEVSNQCTTFVPFGTLWYPLVPFGTARTCSSEAIWLNSLVQMAPIHRSPERLSDVLSCHT